MGTQPALRDWISLGAPGHLVIRSMVSEAAVACINETKATEAAQEDEKTGAVMRVPVSSTDTPPTHLVEIGSLSDARSQWRTLCGWKFGFSNAVRKHVTTAQCEKCSWRVTRQGSLV